jgi:hypothetical protein
VANLLLHQSTCVQSTGFRPNLTPLVYYLESYYLGAPPRGLRMFASQFTGLQLS